MNSIPSIFISYNPSSDFEQVLAVRLFTIGGVNGYNIFLPDRFAAPEELSLETQHRIRQANFFILFSTGKLSKSVQQEINYAYQAYQDKSRILIIYDKVKGKNLAGAENCTEVFIDRRKPLNEIVQSILAGANLNSTPIPASNNSKSTEYQLGGLLLIGLGLLLANNSKR